MSYTTRREGTEPDDRFSRVVRGAASIDLYCFVVVLVSLRQPFLWFLETTNWLADARWERSAYLNIATLVIYAPAIALGVRTFRRPEPVGVLLAGFLTWTILTSAFNRIPEAQAHDLMMVIATVLAFMGLQALIGVDHLLLGTLVATQLGIVLSALIVSAGGGISYPHGTWAGAFGNKNHLGFVCGISALTAVHLIIRNRRVWRFWTLGLVSIPLAFSLWVLGFKTANASGVAGLFVAAVGSGLAITARRVLRPANPRGTRRFTDRAILPAYALTVLAGAVIGRELLSALVGRSASFTGRTRFWSEGLTGTLERPITGWGWWTAHDSPDFVNLFESFSGFTTHSFWVQTALGSGVIGFTLAVAMVIVGLASLSEAVVRGRMGVIPAVALPLYGLIFFSAEDVRSQYAMGFALLIALMIAAVGSTTPIGNVDGHPSPHSGVQSSNQTRTGADSLTS